LLVSLWFRRSYDRVLQRDTNVGTGTLARKVCALCGAGATGAATPPWLAAVITGSGESTGAGG